MTIIVTNDRMDIELRYAFVDPVETLKDGFVLHLNDGETAMFPWKDEKHIRWGFIQRGDENVRDNQ